MSTPVAALQAFAHNHDDLPAFHAGYLVLTLLMAAMFNLGAFGILVITHIALDIVKYRDCYGFCWKITIKAAVRESLVDITLLMVGLVFSVYLHHNVGIASVSGIMRAEISIIRVVALLIPKVKILHHFLKIVSHIHLYLDRVHPRLNEKWSALDLLCFTFITISFFMLAIAGQAMSVSYAMIQQILMEELLPWNV